MGSFSPATLSTSSLGDHTAFPCQMRLKKIRHPFCKFWVCTGILSLVVVLKNPQREEPRGKPNQILEPPQLARSKQRSSGSTSSSLRMSELLTLSPRQSPASLQKKLDPQSYSFGDYPQWSGATPTELLTTRQTPSLMNKTQKYLASFTWGRGLTPLTTSVFQ